MDESQRELAREIAQELCAGNTHRFRQWVEITHGVVYRLAYRLLGNTSDAEDATQDAYVRAWQGLDSLRKPSAHLAWLCRIARNVCVDMLRKPMRREKSILDAAQREGGTMKDNIADAAKSPEEVAREWDMQRRLLESIELLQPKYRIVILMRDVDEMSYIDIAAALGVPQGTVESRLHRARKQLGKHLQRKALSA